MTPTEFLAGWPPAVAALAERLRGVVAEAIPGAVEGVRVGWKLIGYRLPRTRGGAYVCFIAPQPAAVRLGFERGIELEDHAGLLAGTGSQVRHAELVPGGPFPLPALRALCAQAAERGERRR